MSHSYLIHAKKTEFEGPMAEHRAEVRRRLTHAFPSPSGEPPVSK